MIFALDCLKCFSTTKEVQVSRRIDNDLKHITSSQRAYECRILLLGCGDAGKSTLLRQFKSINGEQITNIELHKYTLTIYSNIIRGIQVLFDAASKLNYAFDETSSIAIGLQLQDLPHLSNDIDVDLFRQYAPLIQQLWSDNALKIAFQNRHQFFLADNVAYFLDNIDRISQYDYIPNYDDIIRCRKPTKCINEYDCTINRKKFKFIDVGGQRSQRNKWLGCFDKVTTVIFVVPCNDFDKVILEDRRTNTIDECKNIFKNIINHPLFGHASVIVAFNKVDLLVKKIETVDIREYQSGFEGDASNFRDIREYFIRSFRTLMPPHISAYFFFTTALETLSANMIYDAVKNIVLEWNVKYLVT